MKATIDKKVRLTLVGLDGNAFAILGAFRRAARQQGWSKEEVEAVVKEAMSGDYDHLLATITVHCEEKFIANADGGEDE